MKSKRERMVDSQIKLLNLLDILREESLSENLSKGIYLYAKDVINGALETIDTEKMYAPVRLGDKV